MDFTFLVTYKATNTGSKSKIFFHSSHKYAFEERLPETVLQHPYLNDYDSRFFESSDSEHL